MANLNCVVKGLKKYLDSELIGKVSGFEKWIVGAGLSMILDNSVNVFNQLKDNALVKAMNVINKDDDIDVDRLHKSFLEQANKSAVTFQIPLIGAVTLKADDIEKIYSFIKEGEK